jgi:hypothetical protein
MRRFGLAIVFFVMAGCTFTAQDGERCNPLQYSSSGTQGDCADGLACVYPTAPNCGVAYCCKLDSQGNVADDNPNCQFDPTLVDVCMLDLGVMDGGSTD